jgi:hypothetical protein
MFQKLVDHPEDHWYLVCTSLQEDRNWLAQNSIILWMIGDLSAGWTPTQNLSSFSLVTIQLGLCMCYRSKGCRLRLFASDADQLWPEGLCPICDSDRHAFLSHNRDVAAAIVILVYHIPSSDPVKIWKSLSTRQSSQLPWSVGVLPPAFASSWSDEGRRILWR